MKQTGKRWQFGRPDDRDLARYVRFAFDDLANHLLEMEQRLSGDTTTESSIAELRASLDTLSATQATISQSLATLSSIVSALSGSRLVKLDITKDLTVPSGYGLLLFDGEQIRATVECDGIMVCI